MLHGDRPPPLSDIRFCPCRPLAGQCVQRWRNGHALMGGVRFSVSDWITSFYELNSFAVNRQE